METIGVIIVVSFSDAKSMDVNIINHFPVGEFT